MFALGVLLHGREPQLLPRKQPTGAQFTDPDASSLMLISQEQVTERQAITMDASPTASLHLFA